MALAGGEILVGLTCGIFGGLARRLGRETVVVVGCVTSMLVIFFIFLLVAKEAPLGQTSPGQDGFIGKISKK
jgi:hypothetical protein